MKSFVSPFSQAIYKRRRQHLIQKLSNIASGDFTALFWSGSEVARNSTNVFPFRANSDFLYLTGFAEPETLIVLSRIRGKIRTAVGVRPRDLSPNRGSEIWDGERVGVERAPKWLGFDEAFDIQNALAFVKSRVSETPTVFWSLGMYPEWDEKILKIQTELTAQMRGIVKVEELADPRPALHEMRNVKSIEEAQMMKRAAQIAAEGHIRAMRTTRSGHFEFEAQAEVEREFKKYGAQIAYNSIVAGGANACTLHYGANRDRLEKNSLLLIDAGAEYCGYASDITRCLPVSGKFTPAQAEVYGWVLKAQLAAIQAVRPGVSFYKPHETATKVLCQGLQKMGFFKKKTAATIYKKGLYKSYFPHGTSHWLGMDVHDCGIYRTKTKDARPVTLKPGNVMTIEPGLYFRIDDSSVPKKFRGIGVRIEDDVLVTKSGHEVLSKSCPKEIKDIEALWAPKL
jgi:Xaa-Pro aminopeptidase